MSANFYNSFTQMLGVDCHEGDAMPWIYKAYCPMWWFISNDKRTTSVTADSCKMIQYNLSCYMFDHVTFVQTPKGIALAAAAWAGSTTSPFIARESVTGNGAPLACAMDGFFGFNANCNKPVTLPSGATFSFSTVRTSPTYEDLAWGVGRMLWGIAVSKFVAHFLKMFLPKGASDIAKVYFEAALKLVYRYALKPLIAPLFPDVDRFVQRVFK